MSATNLRVLVTGTAGRVARAAAGDRGSSLILVIGLTTAVTLTVITLSGYALSGYVMSKKRADWTTAVAAAQAGIDDYIARLNENELYWTTGQTDTTNPAFTSWTPVPGARNKAAFRYSVDISATPSTGYVTVTSSGRVDGEVRTIQATLKRGRFLDFVYYSDYETGDPANPLFYSGSYWRNRDPAAVCGVYNWAAGWNTRNPNCPRIYWRDDVVVGRFHTNDTFFARIHVEQAGQIIEVDSRPSDAIALAVRTGVPIYADESVLDRAGVLLNAEGEPVDAAGGAAGITPEERAKLSAFSEFISELDLDDFD